VMAKIILTLLVFVFSKVQPRSNERKWFTLFINFFEYILKVSGLYHLWENYKFYNAAFFNRFSANGASF